MALLTLSCPSGRKETCAAEVGGGHPGVWGCCPSQQQNVPGVALPATYGFLTCAGSREDRGLMFLGLWHKTLKLRITIYENGKIKCSSSEWVVDVAVVVWSLSHV